MSAAGSEWISLIMIRNMHRTVPSGCVELCHQLAVSRACGRQLLLGQVEPVAGVDELLLEFHDSALQYVDVLWRSVLAPQQVAAVSLSALQPFLDVLVICLNQQEVRGQPASNETSPRPRSCSAGGLRAGEHPRRRSPGTGSPPGSAYPTCGAP